jgi:hypothetical protein
MFKIHKIIDFQNASTEEQNQLIQLLDSGWKIITATHAGNYFVEYVLEKDVDEDVNEQHIKDALKLDSIINGNFYVGSRGKLRLAKPLKKEDYDFLRNYILPF